MIFFSFLALYELSVKNILELYFLDKKHLKVSWLPHYNIMMTSLNIYSKKKNF